MFVGEQQLFDSGHVAICLFHIVFYYKLLCFWHALWKG